MYELEATQVDFNDLSKYVYQKYGLKFQPAIPGSKELYVLMSPLDSSYFAMMSRIKKDDAGIDGPGHIATLDLRCGDFSDMIRDLPGFTSAFRLKSKDWVGVWLDRGNDQAIKNALDYAFKLAMNGDKLNIADTQYIYVPGEKTDEKYQEQKIKPRREVIRRNKQKQVPDQIQKMLESYDYSILPAKGRAKNFYNQAKMMADYSEEYDQPAAFKRYYPTYHDMMVPQLRTYFTWRKKIREGKFEKTSTSYAYVYIYELLNNIGVKNSDDGFEKLNKFKEYYAQKYDVEIVGNLDRWLKDYVLYYHLDREKVNQVFENEIATDKDYHVLLHPNDYSISELVEVFKRLSPYLSTCLSYKKLGDNFDQVFAEIWNRILVLKRKNNISFFSKYVAHRNLLVENLFTGAVFYPQKNELQSYIIDPERKYLYKADKWYVSVLHPVKRQRSELNTFIHEVDRLMRIKFRLGRPLKPRKLEKVFLQAIETGIDTYQQKVEDAKRPKIEINFASLGQIRADASVTRDSLLTDEEKQLEAEEEKKETQKIKESNPPVEKEPQTKETYGLSKDELFFLMSLLTKKSWQDYVKKRHLMASILADNINDKLFDEIGDAVIEFNDQDQPEIIADYLPDLEEMFLSDEGE